MRGFRLATGGRIDRSTAYAVTFDGASLDARPGDTLASALLASGRRTVAHSVLLGRPRGVYAAGVEEPNALVQIDRPFPEPMLTAPTVEVVDGLAASSLWGQGRLATEPDTTAHDAVHHFCEVLVVGAGPAGLAAALAAAESGVRVCLVDERPTAGGAMLSEAEVAWAVRQSAQLAALGVTVLQRTTAIGYYDDNFVVAVQRFVDADPVRERVWRLRAADVVLATGGHERPIVFADNDLPGVMLAESVRSYALRYGVAAGRRVVVFTAHDDTERVVRDLRAAGLEVTTVDARSGSLVTAALAGPDGSLAGVRVRAADGTEQELAADVLAVSGGWNPAVHLYSQAGGRLVFDEAVGSFVPDSCRQRVRVAGAARGLRTNAECVADGAAAGTRAATPTSPELVEGQLVGASSGSASVSAGSTELIAPPDGLNLSPAPGTNVYLVAPDDADPRILETHFVDLQRDVSVADLARATGAGLASVEHVKRYTTAGTAHDQGKTSGLLATAVVSQLLGVKVSELGTTTYRPPYTPVAFATLAGRERGLLYDPIRTTGAHAWHVDQGAQFENVGQWLRPWFYPRQRADGTVEDLPAAVARECAAARTGVAFMDGSTLGKIEVQGPDAGAFLDLIYTNLISTLKVGSIRYGVMCTVDGMVLDDGTVFRLDDHRFLLTTTTGNAAKILDWLEEWQQTEWPHLQVWFTSVTEQWATMAIVGPRSRDLVGALAPELAVSNDDFPFMTWRDTTVAGRPARVARISFSGELAYEVNVAWSDAAALWAAVWATGEPVGLTPYGTETMHVLRAEKGYPIVGQDTDGTITPQDLGMSWVVSKKKADYLGKRSHARPDNLRPDRKHLVGLLPVDPTLVVPEGSQLVAAAPLPAPPVPMLGYVTSSYFSAALGRPFALALCARGRDRAGETIFAVVDGEPHAVEITSPVLVDPDGARRDGDPIAAPVNFAAVPAWDAPAVLPVSPLADVRDHLAVLTTPALTVAEVPFTTQVNVRVRRGSPAAAALTNALGVDLPGSTGLVASTADVELLALGPDEFLVLAAPGRGDAMTALLRPAVGEIGSVVDVTAARTTLTIGGRDARRLLRHGLPVDLDRLTPDTVAQTLLAQCAVIVVADGAPGSEDDQLRILVRSSFAAHLAAWLTVTAGAV